MPKSVSFSTYTKVKFLDDAEEDRRSEFNSNYVLRQRIIVHNERKLEAQLAALFSQLSITDKRNGIILST